MIYCFDIDGTICTTNCQYEDAQPFTEVIEKINNDPTFHGILVQLPLPKHIDSKSIINSSLSGF